MTVKRLVNTLWDQQTYTIDFIRGSQCDTHRKTDSLFTPAMVDELKKLTAHE